MDMKNRYKELFDGIAPIKSDEELLKAVLDRKVNKMNEKKKINKRLIVLPIAAAVALGGTAVGVGAANNWSLASAFEGLFRQNFVADTGSNNRRDVSDVSSAVSSDTDLSDVSAPETEALSSIPKFDFTSCGMEIGSSFTGEGFTVTIDGIVADHHTAYILYTIDFRKDFPYESAHTAIDGEGWDSWELGGSMKGDFYFDGDLENHYSSLGYHSETLPDGSVAGTFCLMSEEMDIAGRTLNMRLDHIEHSYLSDYKHVKTESMPIDISMDIDLDFNMDVEERVVHPDYRFEPENGTIIVDEIMITPFMTTFNLVSEKPLPEDPEDSFTAWQELTRGFGDISLGMYLNFADGTSVPFSPHVGSEITNGEQWACSNDYPVNPEDIVSVTIFGEVIELD